MEGGRSERAGDRSHAYAAGFGLLLRREEGWDYLVAGDESGTRLYQGRVEFRGPQCLLYPSESLREEAPGRFAALLSAAPPAPLRAAAVCLADERGRPLPGEGSGSLLPELRLEELEPRRDPGLLEAEGPRVSWSGDFSPRFYRAQARAGLIATAWDRGDRAFLLPELQEAYAVLDWANLRPSRSYEALRRCARVAALEPRLEVSSDPAEVLAAHEAVWGAESWLVPEYAELLRRLSAERGRGLELWGVGLSVAAEGQGGARAREAASSGARPERGRGPLPGARRLAAGEIGYSVGRTYTSLTGFTRRDDPRFRGLGTLQLRLLASLLRERGYAFWNLGHPYMEYKLSLGARVLPREDFLARWDRAAAEPDPGLA